MKLNDCISGIICLLVIIIDIFRDFDERQQKQTNICITCFNFYSSSYFLFYSFSFLYFWLKERGEHDINPLDTANVRNRGRQCLSLPRKKISLVPKGLNETNGAQWMSVLHLQETEGLMTFFALIVLVLNDQLMRELVDNSALMQLFKLLGCRYCINKIEGVLTCHALTAAGSWVNRRTRRWQCLDATINALMMSL